MIRSKLAENPVCFHNWFKSRIYLLILYTGIFAILKWWSGFCFIITILFQRYGISCWYKLNPHNICGFIGSTSSSSWNISFNFFNRLASPQVNVCTGQSLIAKLIPVTFENSGYLHQDFSYSINVLSFSLNLFSRNSFCHINLDNHLPWLYQLLFGFLTILLQVKSLLNLHD